MALTVLTMRGLGLGGLLTAVPALRGIRRALPAHRHVLATSPWVAQVVPLLGPGLVDEVYLAVRRPVVLPAGRQGGAPQARNAG